MLAKSKVINPPWQQSALGVFIVRALSGQHELLMDRDADLSVTSRTPGCKHTHTYTHTKSVFVSVSSNCDSFDGFLFE